MSIQLLANTFINVSRKNYSLGKVQFHVYSDEPTSSGSGTPNKLEYIVLIKGEVANCYDVLTRIHSECITGDLFGSDKCDCGQQLDFSYELISQSDNGIIIYIRGHEGRGIGLVEKIKAYNLQETKNLDTIQANIALGHQVDSRNFDNVNILLEQLLVKSIVLITNNPDKINTVKNISRIINTTPQTTDNNAKYIKTKIQKLGHLINLPLI